ncbi:DUF929 family protein [Dictyobacter arantiisoli]|uniref:DUF929 domain-containing protein n=1 Tax=Dictyobacter arantiisoli TaxID=2014874 RepID=A0A5A5T954_9CHLR|nr:DUF929 family protein [Dictyobacter arantiisoli]GCF07918.1 hypothetical protein KDI_14820 [Dictyobacter arantiisoli]
MAKVKHHTTSAAQRREQERVQRGQRNQVARNQARSRRSKKSSRNAWLIVGVTVVLLVLLIVGFVLLGNNKPSQKAVTVKSTVYQSLTNVKPALLSQVGAGSVSSGLSSVLKPVKNTPVLKGPNGKPQVFYMGGEFCPYCGAQRWAMIVALSRFGTFTTAPSPLVSGELSVPTFSFFNSAYKSDYIDFVPVEVSDNSQPNPKPLQKLTPEQQQLVNTYDAPPYTSAASAGSFPFISVGNQYVSAGAYFPHDILIGNTHDYIVSQLQDPTTDISRAVLGSANYLTAQICKITNNQPGSVCNADPIPSLQGKLPQASLSTGNTVVTNSVLPQAIETRKRIA